MFVAILISANIVAAGLLFVVSRSGNPGAVGVIMALMLLTDVVAAYLVKRHA